MHWPAWLALSLMAEVRPPYLMRFVMGGYNGLWGIGRTIGTAGYQLDRKKRTDFPDKPTVKRFLLGRHKNSTLRVATVPRLWWCSLLAESMVHERSIFFVLLTILPVLLIHTPEYVLRTFAETHNNGRADWDDQMRPPFNRGKGLTCRSPGVG